MKKKKKKLERIEKKELEGSNITRKRPHHERGRNPDDSTTFCFIERFLSFLLILPHADSFVPRQGREKGRRITPFSFGRCSHSDRTSAPNPAMPRATKWLPGERERRRGRKKGKEGGLRHAGGSDLPIVCADRVLKSSALCAIVPSSVFTLYKSSLGA